MNLVLIKTALGTFERVNPIRNVIMNRIELKNGHLIENR